MKGAYTTKIEYTRTTLTRLFRLQYYTFGKVRIAVRFSAGILLVIAAFLLSFPMLARVMLLISGIWLTASIDFPARLQVNKVITTRQGKLPVIRYEFFPDSVRIYGDGSMNITYKSFAALLHDDEYCYLIISRELICMMEKPEEYSSFMKFMHDKTGLAWHKNKPWQAWNITFCV